MATKPRGGGLKAIVDCPLKKNFFCGFPKRPCKRGYTKKINFTVDSAEPAV